MHNTYFTLPVLFAMLSNHYSFTRATRKTGWLVLILMMPGGRHPPGRCAGCCRNGNPAALRPGGGSRDQAPSWMPACSCFSSWQRKRHKRCRPK